MVGGKYEPTVAVDGQNFAPVDMVNIHCLTALDLTLVQDFVHQRFHCSIFLEKKLLDLLQLNRATIVHGK